ncbi:hypothetical protein AYI69_g4191 [Smittium culicis]|uniref:Uncharacterized protein n=1 Tax=Smittium culicis TaxID=133412 RepID=A0A1R1YFR6_9FUNG|nr:hypothetical protein AYI69_g4191 [Smittium culicis]
MEGNFPYDDKGGSWFSPIHCPLPDGWNPLMLDNKFTLSLCFQLGYIQFYYQLLMLVFISISIHSLINLRFTNIYQLSLKIVYKMVNFIF